jgi:FkbM family methyltransferase
VNTLISFKSFKMMMKSFLKKIAITVVFPLLNRLSLSMSQAGQDFWVYGEVFNEKLEGYFLDVGAHDGLYLSNTYLLEKRYGWRGLCIEGNPTTFTDLQRNRTAKCVNACLDSKEGEVDFAQNGVYGGIVSKDCDNQEEARIMIKMKTRRLADVLEENGAPAIIDYLSIDVEGAEDRVLLGFPFEKYRFKCITIERPSPQLRSLLDQSGYLLVREIPGLDCFYIHETLQHQNQYHESVSAFYSKKLLFKRWR